MMGGETPDLNKKFTRVMAALENSVDTTTNALGVIDYAHKEIHGESHYFIQGYVEMNTTTLPFRMKMVTPDSGKRSHFVFSIDSSGITSTTLDEDVTGGMADGTSKIPFNNDRESTNTSGVIFTSGVTAGTSYQTRLEDDKWGVAAGKKIFLGGGASREDELKLKRNITYLRTFTSFSDNNIIQFKASWYEHTDK